MHLSINLLSVNINLPQFSFHIKKTLCIQDMWCSQCCDCLYFTSGSRAFPRAEFGEGSGAVYLEGVACEGDEGLLLDCGSSEDLGLSECGHNEDVGVRCYGG